MSTASTTASKSTVLFNQHDYSQPTYSQEISVGSRPVKITHWNPVEGEYLCLMEFEVNKCSDGGNITPVKCNGQPVCICCAQNAVIVDMPGRYKLVKYGVSNNAQVTMKHLPAQKCTS